MNTEKNIENEYDEVTETELCLKKSANERTIKENSHKLLH